MKKLLFILLVSLSIANFLNANSVTMTVKELLKTFGISTLEKTLLKNSVYVSKFGKLVAQRNSTFFPNIKDALGRTNRERMKQGLAPIGKDGKAVELHHLKQKNDGICVLISRCKLETLIWHFWFCLSVALT